MYSIRQDEAPSDSLHQTFNLSGGKIDCYYVDVDAEITLHEFVYAFYTSWLFKIERWILSWAAQKPSSDSQVRQLLNQERCQFAAWTEKNRTENQLLMCDFLMKTCSWFKVEPILESGGTRLYFGTAIVPDRKNKKGNYRYSIFFSLFGGFHHFYSKALLKASTSNLGKQT